MHVKENEDVTCQFSVPFLFKPILFESEVNFMNLPSEFDELNVAKFQRKMDQTVKRCYMIGFK